MRTNLHIYPTAIVKETRILRITKTLAATRTFDEIVIIGVHEDGLATEEALDEIRALCRVKRKLGLGRRSTFWKALRTAEWTWRVAARYRSSGRACVSCHSLPVLPLCVFLKLATRGNLVYETHELETETVTCRGPRRLIYKILERTLLPFTDEIVVVTDAIADWYRDTYRIARPVVVRNIPDTPTGTNSQDRLVLRKRFGIPDASIVFLYQGVLGPGRCIERMLGVFTQFDADRHIVFIGFGVMEADVRKAAARHKNIHFLPAVPPSELLNWTCGADVGLVGVDAPCLSYFYSLPNKLFEYLVAGVPALANELPEIRRVIQQDDWGWTVENTDEAWGKAIRSITKEGIARKRCAIPAALGRYSWSEEARRLIETYHKVRQPRAGDVSNHRMTPPAGAQLNPRRPLDTTQNEYRICRRCVMDTSDPDVRFDAQGVCTHCHHYENRRRSELPDPLKARLILEQLVAKIKREGQGKAYDCVIGLSGGVDSSYVAYHVQRLGLRALAVHLDNGWNSELAVGNIDKIVSKLAIDLHTHVLDWEEFRDLQRAFFFASVANCEMPTDHAILSVLFDTAVKHGVRFILSGSNLASEGILLPAAWGRDYRDWTNLNAIHEKFGESPLRTFPRLPFAKLAYRVFVNRLRFIPILNYVPYVKKDAISALKTELGWVEYGRKHGESVFTRFYQEFYLPQKFGYDKRRMHFSVLINSQQMSREDALQKLQEPMFAPQELEELMTFFLKKLGFSREQWQDIMEGPCRSHLDYPSNWCFTIRESPLAQLIRRLATGRPLWVLPQRGPN